MGVLFCFLSKGRAIADVVARRGFEPTPFYESCQELNFLEVPQKKKQKSQRKKKADGNTYTELFVDLKFYVNCVLQSRTN